MIVSCKLVHVCKDVAYRFDLNCRSSETFLNYFGNVVVVRAMALALFGRKLLFASIDVK